MKKLQPRHHVYLVLFLLIILSYVGILGLWLHQRSEIKNLNSQVTTIFNDQQANSESNWNAVTISPADHSVYLPLAKLKLPDNNLNESLVYNYTGPYSISGLKKVFPANLSISTHDLANNDVSTTQQFDCAEVAYADFVTPSYPVNPTVKSDGSIKLADGRTMNVYYSPKISGCQGAWRLSQVNSKAIADSLLKATSY